MLGLLLEPAELLHDRPVLVVEPAGRPRGELLQSLGVRQPVVLQDELGLLSRPKPGGVQLLALEPDQAQLPLPGLLLREQVGPTMSQLAYPRRVGVVGRPEVAELAERVEQLNLVRRLQEGVALPLPVDVDQQLPEPAEQGDRDGGVVDVSLAAPLPLQPAGDDYVIVFQRLLEGAFNALLQVRARQLKEPGDAKLVAAGADQVARSALADQEPDGPEQEGFAGPSLARPGAEPRVELDTHVLDEGQVLDRQFPQHVGIVRCPANAVKVGYKSASPKRC